MCHGCPVICEMSAEQLEKMQRGVRKVWLALSRPELKKKFVRELVRLGVECWVAEMPEDRESRIDLLDHIPELDDRPETGPALIVALGQVVETDIAFQTSTALQCIHEQIEIGSQLQ